MSCYVFLFLVFVGVWFVQRLPTPFSNNSKRDCPSKNRGKCKLVFDFAFFPDACHLFCFASFLMKLLQLLLVGPPVKNQQTGPTDSLWFKMAERKATNKYFPPNLYFDKWRLVFALFSSHFFHFFSLSFLYSTKAWIDTLDNIHFENVRKNSIKGFSSFGLFALVLSFSSLYHCVFFVVWECRYLIFGARRMWHSHRKRFISLIIRAVLSALSLYSFFILQEGHNAEKRCVGHYFSTKIWEFKMRCHLCPQFFIIKTDPKVRHQSSERV